MDEKENYLTCFGFSDEPGSTLTKRTIMSNELFMLFQSVPDVQSTLIDYKTAIIEDNCLAKRTVKNRGYSFSYLKRLYGLSPDLIIFRALRYFFERDANSRALLCLLTAYSRDRILQASAGYILNLSPGSGISKTDFENHMDGAFPGRFGTKMLQSLVRNLISSWTQSGHLSHNTKRERQLVNSGSGAISFVLLLGYLTGARGEGLFQTDFAKLLDCHNILNFDLPFIKKRSLIHNVKPTVKFSFYKYQKEPIFDTMLHFDSWVCSKQGSTGLKKLAYALGLDCPKEILGELNVYDAYLAGEYKRLHDYCKADVKATHLIWRKLSGRQTNAKSMALAT